MTDRVKQVSTSREYENLLWFPRVFGPRQCERIVEAGQGLERESALVSSGSKGDHDQLTRIADVSWLSPSKTPWVFEKLAVIVARANRVYQFDLSGFTEDAQFTCYDRKGAFYDWHQDGLEGELAGRKLSLVLQLSSPDDYSGGDLELFSLASDRALLSAWRDDLRQQGSVTVFPAFEFHRVKPVRTGQRYSLVCWIGGPPFR
jgi:PKHD-type hydroxylase